MNEELTRARKLDAWELDFVTGGKGHGGRGDGWEDDWEDNWDDDWDDWD
jgi:hypothetical protein